MSPERSRLLRKRLGFIAFVLALGFLIYQTFDHKDAITSVVVLELGPNSDAVSRVEVDLFCGSDSAGTFSRDRLPGLSIGDPRFTARFSAAKATANIRIYTDGRLIETTRRITPERNATIMIPLADELATP